MATVKANEIAKLYLLADIVQASLGFSCAHYIIFPFASFREASNTQLVTTSQSSYSGGGMEGTTSAAARNAVVNVMVRSPSTSVAASSDVNPRQRLAGGNKLVGDGGEILAKDFGTFRI